MMQDEATKTWDQWWCWIPALISNYFTVFVSLTECWPFCCIAADLWALAHKGMGLLCWGSERLRLKRGTHHILQMSECFWGQGLKSNLWFLHLSSHLGAPADVGTHAEMWDCVVCLRKRSDCTSHPKVQWMQASCNECMGCEFLILLLISSSARFWLE